MASIELEEAPKRPAAQGMSDKTLFALKEGQFIGYIELIRVAVIFRTPAIIQSRVGIIDVVVRRGEAADGGASSEQFRIYVQQFRVGIARLKLQAVAHALLRFHDERVVVGTN